MMINCLLITLIFVIISDELQFWNNFSPIISRLLTKGTIKKPIPSKIMTCSTCQSWWVNLVNCQYLWLPIYWVWHILHLYSATCFA